uniref:disks large homolog 5-like n=1 Tax=Arvicanthis niloticus TaxID=61156 RepID=UPI001486D6EA|nr:disks large homolog 5-like [Arvicanthis niloticus]
MFSRVRRCFRRSEVDMTEMREKRKETGGRSNEGRRRWSWRMWNVRRRTSSPASVIIKRLVKEEEERLTEGLQLITQKRNEGNDRLILLTEEESIIKRPFRRLHPEYEVLKYKEKKVMSFLHNVEMDTIKAHRDLQELKKETHFYSNLQKRIVTERNLVQEHLNTLNQEMMAVYIDLTVIQKYMVDFNPNDKDEQEKTSNLQTEHHQVGTSI